MLVLLFLAFHEVVTTHQNISMNIVPCDFNTNTDCLTPSYVNCLIITLIVVYVFNGILVIASVTLFCVRTHR